jgi:hypothetical protein
MQDRELDGGKKAGENMSLDRAAAWAINLQEQPGVGKVMTLL